MLQLAYTDYRKAETINLKQIQKYNSPLKEYSPKKGNLLLQEINKFYECII